MRFKRAEKIDLRDRFTETLAAFPGNGEEKRSLNPLKWVLFFFKTYINKPFFYTALAVYVLLALFFNYLLDQTYNEKKIIYLDSQAQIADHSFNVLYKSYCNLSRFIYYEIVGREDVLQLLDRAWKADPKTQDMLRRQIIQKLNITYRHFLEKNLSQFQFHFPDNTSFVSLNQPEKFGDDMSGIRYSVACANRTEKEIYGFEHDFSASGFRSVFPIRYNNRHIGVFDIGFKFEALENILNYEFGGDDVMLVHLDDEIRNKAVFKDVFKNYISSTILPDYYYVKSPRRSFFEIKKTISSSDISKIRKKIKTNKPFCVYSEFNEETYLWAFVPVFDAKNNKTAYIISCRKDETIHSFKTSSLFFTLLIQIGIFLIFVYFVRSNELKTRLQSEMKKVELAARSKSLFLASMSHEIRTPMNGILGISELLEESPLDEKQRKYVEMIRNSGCSLLTIINDILDFSKIESGKMSLESHEMDVERCVDSCFSLLQYSAQAKKLDLRFEIPPHVPRKIISDTVRLRQILLNLLSNAIKFTDAGEICLAVSAIPIPDSEEIFMEFAVKDTGIGIDSKVLNRLFMAFEQGDASSTRRFGGTGLGLAITKRLTALMGGDVRVVSTLEKGSTFTASIRTIPVKAVDESTKTVKSYGSPVMNVLKEELKDLRVLLVEDDRINQAVTLTMLESVGIIITLAENGQKALDKLQSNQYDIILMDCMMPVMDGFTAPREIIRIFGSNHPPIIALTANAMSGDREHCLKYGMNDFLSKPISKAKLLEAIRKWNPRRRTSKA
jgi:signal transduction histidine kinase/ActR/RegA family two-component response regulator